MECIFYKAGYKYQLNADYSARLNLKPLKNIKSEYVDLSVDGGLTIKQGYAWDGPSGPTIDTLDFMRGSLVHDALYQLIREGFLTADPYRKLADEELRRICREDGMPYIRTWWVYQGVRFGAAPAATKACINPLISAPRGCQKMEVK